MNRLAASLLVVVPALVIGGITLGLLVREDERRREREEQAAQAVRAAARERFHTAAENLNILLEEVRTGLLDALEILPGTWPDEHFVAWATANPLVRTVLVWDPGLGWVLPGAGTPDRTRLAAFLAAPVPWLDAPSASSALVRGEADASAPHTQLEEVQALTNLQRFRDVREQVAKDVRRNEARLAARAAAPPVLSTPHTDALELTSKSLAPGGEIAAREEVESHELRKETLPPRPTGWTLHGEGPSRVAVAWCRLEDGRVRALELDRAALASRLAEALPQSEAGMFALVDPRGVPTPTALGTTDLFLELSGPLAGWLLAFQPSVAPRSVRVSFLALGAVFTIAVVGLITAGSLLLLREVRHAEAEARERATFVSNISHEFKTPLTTIRLYADLLRRSRGAHVTERETRYLDTITSESERLAGLVGRVLDLGRLERGQLHPRSERLDLAELVNRLAKIQQPRLADAGIQLRVEGAGSAYPWCGDARIVEQIVLNLLDNVAKYAATGREAVLALKTGPGGPCVEVLDRGPGVPPAFCNKLFRRFERADQRLDARAGGTGIGLHLARALARAHGGDLLYVPRAGGGACFRLELPRGEPVRA